VGEPQVPLYVTAFPEISPATQKYDGAQDTANRNAVPSIVDGLKVAAETVAVALLSALPLPALLRAVTTDLRVQPTSASKIV
jgi:hypothetical protein